LIKGIIFDFDGVIVDSVQVKTDAFFELYSPYGSEIADKVVKHHILNGGMSRYEKINYYHKTYLNKSVTKTEIAFLAKRFSKLVINKVIDSPYIPGVLDYIKKSVKNYMLFISTGTPINEIKQILLARKINKYFSDVFGSPDNKNIHINNIISNYNITSDELLFYGDSKVDMDAANNNNIDFILINNIDNKDLTLQYSGQVIDNFKGLI